ncbi:MAG: hypothetical protein J2P54_02390 [Bradyrhizobiaceae bacterium]|nr:hypothetical protein [Bradyrhizobiaceae bacterium]
MRSVKVVGVHPIEADEPCHLIELAIWDPDREFNLDDLTQVDDKIRRGLWQVAYDERYLDAQNLQPLGHNRPDRKEYRLAFFFHYLDLAKLLESSFGPLALPQPSPRPEYLDFMEWGPP